MPKKKNKEFFFKMFKLHFLFFPPTFAKRQILFYFFPSDGAKKPSVGHRQPNNTLQMP